MFELLSCSGDAMTDRVLEGVYSYNARSHVRYDAHSIGVVQKGGFEMIADLVSLLT